MVHVTSTQQLLERSIYITQIFRRWSSPLKEGNLKWRGVKKKSKMEALNLARYALSLDLGSHLWLLEPHDTLLIPIIFLLVNKACKVILTKHGV
jgi:hypothetical protein